MAQLKDSPAPTLSTLINPQERIDALNRRARDVMGQDIVRAINLSRVAEGIAVGDNDEESYPAGLAESRANLGRFHLLLGDEDAALEYLHQALPVAQIADARRAVAQCHQDLAEIYKRRGDFEKAFTHFEQFHRLRELLLDAEAADRMRRLELTYDLEKARQQVEIYHLRNVALKREIEEKELLIADLNAFAHSVAHDLKNPVSTIVGFSEILIGELGEATMPLALEFAQSINDVGGQMGHIIDGLLMLAQVSQREIEPEPLTMTEIVDAVERRLAQMMRESGAMIMKPAGWPIAVGHGPWIEEVWANLISNGIKYGGKPPQIELGAEVDGGSMIRFWIRDNGDGLTPDKQAMLFQAFTRLDPNDGEGHGLGLSVAKRDC